MSKLGMPITLPPLLVRSASSEPETVFHVTVASNFARAFDKYSRVYDKRQIPESTFKEQFFVLRRSELSVGIEKASRLLVKLGLPGNRLIVLEATKASSLLLPNLTTGLGRYLATSRLPVNAVHWVNQDGTFVKTTVEEVMAVSLRCLSPVLTDYERLTPRSFSVLPVARACQARCKFCFSESSASVEQAPGHVDVAAVQGWAFRAHKAGASRMVITGGGEPGLLRHDLLLQLIQMGGSLFNKVVLISNGVHLAKLPVQDRRMQLADYANAGLSVLALSRHHHRADRNAQIMRLATGTEAVLATAQELSKQGVSVPAVRLICVLQREGVGTASDIKEYLQWAAASGVTEVCFKELYVSTTSESAYHAASENKYSELHQVPLQLLIDTLQDEGFTEVDKLPWGSPVFKGRVNGVGMRVAAYTEPSVYWERSQGIARSWNLMADGQCLSSLEDPRSVIAPAGGQRGPSVIPLMKAA